MHKWNLLTFTKSDTVVVKVVISIYSRGILKTLQNIDDEAFWKPLTTFAKSFIRDVWQGTKYVFVLQIIRIFEKYPTTIASSTKFSSFSKLKQMSRVYTFNGAVEWWNIWKLFLKKGERVGRRRGAFLSAARQIFNSSKTLNATETPLCSF